MATTKAAPSVQQFTPEQAAVLRHTASCVEQAVGLAGPLGMPKEVVLDVLAEFQVPRHVGEAIVNALVRVHRLMDENDTLFLYVKPDQMKRHRTRRAIAAARRDAERFEEEEEEE